MKSNQQQVKWSTLLYDGTVVQGMKSEGRPGDLNEVDVEAFEIVMPGHRSFVVIVDRNAGERFSFNWTREVEVSTDVERWYWSPGIVLGGVKRGLIGRLIDAVLGISASPRKLKMTVWPGGYRVVLTSRTIEGIVQTFERMKAASVGSAN